MQSFASGHVKGSLCEFIVTLVVAQKTSNAEAFPYQDVSTE